MIDFRLRKIIILNFACYSGENILDFDKVQGKNIYLFKLRNGEGKTSLFHAIKWGFYGESIDYFKDSDKISIKEFLNDRSDYSNDSCSVKIFFEYKDIDYELMRVYTPSQSKSSSFSLIKEGVIINDSEQAQEELNQIFPKNFADFFMFDGEQLSKFTSAQKEFYFRDSIHQLLGLKQIETLRDDLKSLSTRYDNQLIQLDSTNKEVNLKRECISCIMRDIDNHKIVILECEGKISENDNIIDRLEEQRMSYQNLPKVIEDLEVLNENISKHSLEKGGILKGLQLNSKLFFLTFLKRDLNSFIEDNETRIYDLNDVCGLSDEQADAQKAKEDILRRSIPKCSICGHTLDEMEMRRLKDEQKQIKNQLLLFKENKVERDGLKKEMVFFKNFINRLDEMDFQGDIDNLCDIDRRLEDYAKDKKKLDKESQKEEYGDLGKINRDIGNLQDDNSGNRAKIKLLYEKINLLEKQKEKITKEIKILGHDDTIMKNLTNKISRTSRFIRLLDDTLEKGTAKKREKIIMKSNELFLDITNKPDEYKGLEFESEESFGFIIKTNDGKIVIRPSKGEKQVMAMSFLLGLNQYTGRNNVIVMDTPVASLDDIHSAGIGEALSKLDNQIIFLAQPIELKGDIYNNMKHSIAKEYSVERSDYKSKFKEESI